MTAIKDSNIAGASRSFPKVKHLRPCGECPFRRKAPAGWLGGGTVEDWHALLCFGDTAFVCHTAEKRGKRHLCAGSAIHFRNSLKTPRDPAFAAMVMRFAKDAVTVFAWPHEFKAHHEAGLLALTKKDRHIAQGGSR